MRRILISLITLLLTSPVFAAGWTKAYFSATPPGSWARYSDTAGEANMTTTMTRLADDGGRARLEIVVEFQNGEYPPVRNLYSLASGFAVDRQLIDYMSAIASGAAASGDNAVTEYDAATVAAIVKSSPPYAPSATFKAAETVAGKPTDRYGYSLKRPGNPPSVETGDLWLNATVPFGVVKQTSVTKDNKGVVTSSYERLLIASGTKAAGAAHPAVKTAAAPKTSSKTLNEAYEAGLIYVTVTIAPATRNGERAHLMIATKEDERLTLVVPKGRTTLRGDMPLESFVFDKSAEKSFPLGDGKSAELDVTQLGDKRAMDGSFKLSVYEGTPLFSGSATVGWVKKK